MAEDVAARMRHYRARKKQGMQPITIAVDPRALQHALQEAFQKDFTRDELPEATAKLLAEISQDTK